MMTDYRNARILVTGAAGKLGQAVLAELAARGATNVVAGSRHPDKVGPGSIAKVRVDFDDPPSLDAAFKGVERLLIISTDALDEPGKRGMPPRARSI